MKTDGAPEGQPTHVDLVQQHLEPGSQYLAGQGDVQAQVLASIAFSLKRIADALNYTTGPDNIHDMLNDIRHNSRSGPR